MAWSRKVVIWTLGGTTAGIIAAAIVIVPRIGTVKFITGAVLIADRDARKQLPIPSAKICGEVGDRIACTSSDATGFFRLTWPERLWWGQAVRLTFKHASYQPQTVTATLTHQIYLAHLVPARASETSEGDGPIINLANLRVRYSVKSTNTVEVGSSVKTFEVFNTANAPCSGKVCSPDGRFAAMLGSFEMDAGPGQEFQNARISCLAGPCPFTRVEKDEFSRGGRMISGRVRVLADTATFLVEADVVRTALSDVVRQSYPSTFGRSMTFTLPPSGQGPSIQADVDGGTIVFPLGPAMILSWATCNLQITANQSKLYRCVLKPGYRFH